MIDSTNDMRLDSRTVPEQSFPGLITKLSPRTQPKISSLANPGNWEFHQVFILCENHRFTLVVQSKTSTYFAKEYKSLKAAQKAFSKLFPVPILIKSIYEGSQDLNPLWSDTFTPDQKWLEDKRKLLDTYYSKYKSHRPNCLTVYLHNLTVKNQKGVPVTLKYIGNRLPSRDQKKSPPAAYIGYKREILIQGEVSMLLNSSIYNLECVYIKVDVDGFRLVAFHRNQPILNKLFNNPHNAKLGFLSHIRSKALKRDVKPVWSHFYYPAGNSKNVVIFNPYLTPTIQPLKRGNHDTKP